MGVLMVNAHIVTLSEKGKSVAKTQHFSPFSKNVHANLIDF